MQIKHNRRALLNIAQAQDTVKFMELYVSRHQFFILNRKRVKYEQLDDLLKHITLDGWV